MIPARGHRVMHLLWAGALAIAGCRSAAPRYDATLLLRIHGPAQTTYLNDAPIPHPGRGAAQRVRLPAGICRIEVQAPGHLTAYREVSLSSQKERAVDIHLRPDPDAADAPEPARPAEPGQPR